MWLIPSKLRSACLAESEDLISVGASQPERGLWHILLRRIEGMTHEH